MVRNKIDLVEHAIKQHSKNEKLYYDLLDSFGGPICNYSDYLSTEPINCYVELKDVDKRLLNEKYAKIPIKSRLDIALSPIEICKILNKEAGAFLKQILKDIEDKILIGKLHNDKDSITDYIIDEYQENLP